MYMACKIRVSVMTFRESAGSYRIKMMTNHYGSSRMGRKAQEGIAFAPLNSKEVFINGILPWKDDYQKFYFNLNKERMAQEGIMLSIRFRYPADIVEYARGLW